MSLENLDSFAEGEYSRRLLGEVMKKAYIPCRWQEILFRDYLDRRVSEGASFFDIQTNYTLNLFKNIRDRIDDAGNVYISINGLLNSGKSYTAIFFSKKINDYRGRPYSLENVCTNLQHFARLLNKYGENFSCVFEEAQNIIPAVSWHQIPEEYRKVITSQRKLGIDIVYTNIIPQDLFFGVIRVMNYYLEIRYKCSQHVHGYVWEVDVANLNLKGRFRGYFTIPLTWLLEDDELCRVLLEYEEKIKLPYMKETQRLLVEGGLERKIAYEFIKDCIDKGIDISKANLQVYCDLHHYGFKGKKVERTWYHVDNLIQTGEAQKLLDVKIKKKREVKKKKVKVKDIADTQVSRN